ncbi:MAG: hypothetical protein WCI05_18735 [Myxococcales bacterium]|jgi:hypothetical protein
MNPSTQLFRTTLAALSLLGFAEGCASLAPPFDRMKGQPITVYRLQNFEGQAAPTSPPTSQGTSLGFPGAEWAQKAAPFLQGLLPPNLIPPGILPGTQPGAPQAQQQRFENFPILGYQQPSDAALKSDILDTFGKGSHFVTDRDTCMFPEFGFALAQADGTQAHILVSLSCRQVQARGFVWPHANVGIPNETAKKIADIAKRTFPG